MGDDDDGEEGKNDDGRVVHAIPKCGNYILEPAF
jgi:hypothetical protein